MKLVKQQVKIQSLKVFCVWKANGCSWCGTLELLQSHREHCDYVESKCPRGCNTALLKKFVDSHFSNECPLRRVACQYCSVEVLSKDMDGHIADQCEYMLVMCPNTCGASFKRVEQQAHKSMCPEELIKCDFAQLGCKGTFKRKNEEAHSTSKHLKHLSMVATNLKKTLRGNHTAGATATAPHAKVDNVEVKKLKKDLQAMKDTCDQQKCIINKLEDELKEFKKIWNSRQKCVIEEHDARLKKLEEMRDEQNKSQCKHPTENSCGSSSTSGVERIKKEPLYDEDCLSFTINDFSAQKAADEPNKMETPPMYTDKYRFTVGIDANGFGDGRGNSVRVWMKSLPGKYDEELQWPAKVTFTVELQGNRTEVLNWTVSNVMTWTKPINSSGFCQSFSREPTNPYVFISHDRLVDYLKEDSLEFTISPAVQDPDNC